MVISTSMQCQRWGGYFWRYVFILGLAKKVGDNIRIGQGVIIDNISELQIGNNVSLNSYCYLIASGGITIGNNVSIAHHSSIVAESHTWDDVTIPICYNKLIPTPVVIEDDVWVGCGVRIIGPAHIRNRTIIAAGAVVKGELDTHKIYGGIPAKVIKTIDSEEIQTHSKGSE